MTKVKFLGVFLAALLAALTVHTARAAADEPQQAYVVIVGISKYDDPQITPRPLAEADAKALYDVFVNKDFLGVDAKHIKLLLGTPDAKRNSEAATKSNIVRAVQWLGASAKKDDLAIFVFLGQGAPLADKAVYFASDSTFKDRSKNAVLSDEIGHALEKLKSQRFAAFLDVNFRGFDIGKETAPDPNLANFYKEFIGKDDDKAPAASRVVFLANNGLKPSLTLKDHGVFATVLVDGLKGKADTFGYEPDGLITVEELARYVRKEVADLNRKVGKNDEEKGQQPIVLEYQTHNFILDLNPAITEKTAKRITNFEKIATDAKLAKDLVEEGRTLLHRMPKLEAQQSLRKAYQKLADGAIDAAAFAKDRDTILASTRMTDAEAFKYAATILEAIGIVQKDYFKEVNPGTLVEQGIRGMYKRLDTPPPPSITERLDNAKTLTPAAMNKLLMEARRHLGKREDLDNGKDITLTLESLLSKLDRHTGYIDPETLEKERGLIFGNFSGIGVQIRKNNTKDMLQVVTPIMGSPAYKAKMYAGDIITTIIREVDSKGKPLQVPEVISTKGLSTEDAVKKILGEAGTKIKLIVEREGVDRPIEFNLIRGRVELESVVGIKRNADDSWDYVVDPDNKICYVRLTQFSRNTARDLELVMKRLNKVGIKGFVLDLRFNPGGLLDSAVKISDLFIDDGMIVTIKPRNGPETSYVGKSDGSYLTFPMVCLVNGFSASGSEIVAAALQDHNRAIIMGTRSYGKGSVQTIMNFPTTGGQLKVTTATFWRPNGQNLNKASTSGKDEDVWGVTPNKGFNLNLSVKELNDLQDHQRDQEIIHRPDRKQEPRPEFRDRQLDMALQYLRGQIRMAQNNKKEE
jgi:C-terminal peptidase prc